VPKLVSDTIDKVPQTMDQQLIEFLAGGGDTKKLPAKLADYYKRVCFVNDQLLARHTKKKVVSLTKARFSVSDTAAYELVAKTQFIFGTSRKHDKQFYRHMMAEWIVEDIQINRKAGNWKVVAELYKQLESVIGLSRDDDEGPPELPPPATINYQFNLALINAQPIPDLDAQLQLILGNGNTNG
jgi:hypothetical protein